jgi:hypothetical protein
MPLDILSKPDRGFVPPRTVLFQGFHNNPVQITSDQMKQFSRIGLTMPCDDRPVLRSSWYGLQLRVSPPLARESSS